MKFSHRVDLLPERSAYSAIAVTQTGVKSSNFIPFVLGNLILLG